MHHLPDFDVLTQFGVWIIQKIAFANLCEPYHDVITIPFFFCKFESENLGKEGWEIQKFEYFENESNFLDEINSIFSNFSRAFCKLDSTKQRT